MRNFMASLCQFGTMRSAKTRNVCSSPGAHGSLGVSLRGIVRHASEEVVSVTGHPLSENNHVLCASITLFPELSYVEFDKRIREGRLLIVLSDDGRSVTLLWGRSDKYVLAPCKGSSPAALRSVIRNKNHPTEFWSNEHGWVSLQDCDRYDSKNLAGGTLSLPEDGEQVYLQEFKCAE